MYFANIFSDTKDCLSIFLKNIFHHDIFALYLYIYQPACPTSGTLEKYVTQKFHFHEDPKVYKNKVWRFNYGINWCDYGTVIGKNILYSITS